MGRFQRFGLPLLAKELAELSARPRTYQVRVVYAAILVVVCCVVLLSSLPVAGTPVVRILGIGWPVVIWLGYLQRMGLHLVLPILACGVFTTEKERNTLGLLFLTKLGPWTIIFEKLFSRLLLACGFLIISAPLLTLAYSLGGVTIDDLAAHFLSLLVHAVSIVSICLLCSAYCRTTMEALLASYVWIYLVGVVTNFVFIIWLSAHSVMQTQLPLSVWSVPVHVCRLSSSVYLRSQLWKSLWNVSGYAYFTDPPPLGLVGRVPGGSSLLADSSLRNSLLYSLPALFVSGLCVVLARRFLVSRAFVPPTRRIKVLFDWLDQLFVRANDNCWTQGIVLTRPEHRDPNDAPVAWRETTTRSLGQVRYLVRLLLVVELPVLLLLLLSSICVPQVTQQVASVTMLGLWVVLALATCVSVSGLMTGERRQQTLDVLLTTPLSGREIIRQKLAGVSRLIWMCEVPMWTCLFFYATAMCYLPQGNFNYIITQASMMLIYPWLIAWIAMWHGLQSKTAISAVLKSIASCISRCVVPILVIGAVLVSLTRSAGRVTELEKELATIATLLSPLTPFYLSARSHPLSLLAYFNPTELLQSNAWMINAAIQGLIWYRLRKSCLTRADVLLGRMRTASDRRPVVEFAVELDSDSD